MAFGSLTKTFNRTSNDSTRVGNTMDDLLLVWEGSGRPKEYSCSECPQRAEYPQVYSSPSLLTAAE